MKAINIKLTSSLENAQLTQRRHLGRGLFASVDLVRDNVSGKEYALKTLKMSALSERQSARQRKTQILLNINEAKVLKKLGLLEGYRFDKAQDKFYLLLPYYKGRTVDDIVSGKFNHGASFVWSRATRPTSKKLKKIKQACFYALRDLHRKGFVHNDAFLNNFIYDENDKKARLIDFGFAQPCSVLFDVLEAQDFLCEMENLSHMQFRMKDDYAGLKAWCELPKFYADEMLHYIRHNKLEVAKTCFIYGALTIASIYGLGTFAAARMIAMHLIKTLACHELATFFKLKSFEERQKDIVAYNRHLQDNMGLFDILEFSRRSLHSFDKVYEVLSGLFMGLNLYLNFNPSALHSVGSSLPALFGAMPISHQTFWVNAGKNIPVQDLWMVCMMYIPLSDAYHYAVDKLYQHALSEETVEKMTEKAIFNKGGILNMFGNWRKAHRESTKEDSLAANLAGVRLRARPKPAN